MSANRKLQTEVDRVLKKVEEGVEEFDEIWGKVYSAPQQSLKEKYEGDLKKEIKKLQRLRDQIKTWLGSSEIKDKTALIEARKLIEVKMEEFKVCEKETKTKAFSKEGLAREEKLDPREVEKEEKRSWLQGVIERVEGVVETLEADLEKMSNTKGKGRNKEQMERLEARIATNRWHVSKLEQIHRLLDNDSLEPTRLNDIKEEIDYYVECIEDEDAAVGMEADEYNIYEELQLDSLSLGGPPPFLPRGEDGEGEGDDLSADGKERDDGSTGGGASVATSTSNSSAPASKTEDEGAAAAAAREKKRTATVAAVSVAPPAATASPAPTPAAAPSKGISLPSSAKATPAPPTPAAPSAQAAKALPQSTGQVRAVAPTKGQPTPLTPASLAAASAAPLNAAAKAPLPVLPAAAASSKVVPGEKKTQPSVTSAVKGIAEGGRAAKDISNGPVPVPVSVAPTPTPATSWAHAATGSQRGAASTSPALSASPQPPAALPSTNSLSRHTSPSLPPTSASSDSIPAQPLPEVTPPPLSQRTTTDSSESASSPPNSQTPAQPTSDSASKSPAVTHQQQQHLPPVAPLPPQQVVAKSPEVSARAEATVPPAFGLDSQDGATKLQSSSVPPSGIPPLHRPAASATGQSTAPPSNQGQSAQPHMGRVTDIQVLSNLLKMSMTHVPPSVESAADRSRSYTPRNPYSGPTPSSFPSMPPSIIENPNLFERLPPDSLFLAFYYQQGSYQQYLAARQLKKHSWRFHKKYMTWFQRHEEPKMATDDFEEGTYVYFDYESGWCQRIKSEFKFEYAYLENELSQTTGGSGGSGAPAGGNQSGSQTSQN